MSKLQTRNAFSNTSLQDSDLFWIEVDLGGGIFESQKITGLQLKTILSQDPIVNDVVLIDQNTPTTGGVTFNPNTPLTQDILYLSTTNGSTWIYNGSAYVTYVMPVTSTTPFNIYGSSVDAGGNKTTSIQRTGDIFVGTNSLNSIVSASTGLSHTANGFTQVSTTTYSDSYYPIIRQTKRRGTQASSTPAQSGDILGTHSFNSNGDAASITVKATETHGLTTRGSEIILSNCANGSATQVENLKVQQDGKIKVSNAYTLPSTAPTSGQVLGYSSAGVSDWQTLSFSVPQANRIYVDSINGVDAVGRGRVDNPYLTPEYALANTTNTGTVTATTTNSSNVLTSVSSTTNILIGQVITGTGIPYDSVVISKTSNSITLSRTCTASATITATWYTFIELNLNGIFTATGNWLKRGFVFNANDSKIFFGALTLFNITSSYDVHFQFIGGNFYGTNASSIFIASSYITNTANFIIKPNYYYSIGTGFQFLLANSIAFNNLVLDCPIIDCRFGSVADLYGTRAVLRGYRYGLLRGVRTYATNLEVYGITETPASINAIEPQQSTNTKIYGEVIGQFNHSQAGSSSTCVIEASLNGTSHTFRISEYANDSVINGYIIGNVTVEGTRGSIKFNGTIEGNVTNNSSYSSLYAMGIYGAFSSTNNNNNYISSSQKTGRGISSITLTGNSYVICEGNFYNYQRSYANTACSVSIASGSQLVLNNENQISIASLAGTLLNNGYLYLLGNNSASAITGRFENNGTIEITRMYQTEQVAYTPYILVGSGTFISNKGKIFCPNADSKSGLIRKNATGGKVILINTWLHVANNLHPIQILSNTGTAQDVIIEDCKTDYIGNMAIAFSDTTYGTAYAPVYKASGLSIQQNADYVIL